MVTRELPPLRLHDEITTPSGKRYRWGPDEPNGADIPSGRRDSSTMPGGFETADGTLARKSGVDYSDLERLSTWRRLGVGGEVAWEGRLERAPRASGDQISISPSAVGWQAHLEDDKSARIVYVDRDVSRWQEANLARRLALATAGAPQGKIPVAIGAPEGIVWSPPNESLPAFEDTEAWYDAGPGVFLSGFGYRAKRIGAFTSFEASLLWYSTTPDGTVGSTAVTFDDAFRFQALAAPFVHRALMIRCSTTGSVTPAAGHMQSVSDVAVYGAHSAPGVIADSGLFGYLASDVVTDAVGRWAPLLSVTATSVQPSAFVIEHLAFLDATTASEIIRQATRFGLQDWAVWEDKTFWWHDRGARGRSWRARIGPAQLEETGPQVDRVWESVIVSYQDVDGSTRTVGPPGSGADTEDAVLHDTDPENPANKLGIIRRDLLQAGVTTAAGATEIGRRFLEESKLLDTSGRATFTGYVQDDHGITHPYWKVRSGDTVTFVDAADTSQRRIVRADNDHDGRTCTVDLDSPPEGLTALLERLSVVLVPLGV